MIYSAIAPGMALPPTSMWSCGKTEFGQISRSFAAHAVTLRKRPKNLTQIGFPSLRSVKSDRLLVMWNWQGNRMIDIRFLLSVE
jgi:hypothetical protein